MREKDLSIHSPEQDAGLALAAAIFFVFNENVAAHC
jgi:hypothetical protein